MFQKRFLSCLFLLMLGSPMTAGAVTAPPQPAHSFHASFVVNDDLGWK